jgi:ribonucleoside-diphosphate reductase alpha chain
VGDSVEKIWQSAGDMVLALLDGQDALLDLSKLRAEGTPVRGSGGTSSGPASFAVEVLDNFAQWASLGGAEYAGPVATLRYVFSPTLRAIRQGGTRRGAGMATMSITHEDIHDFITAKDLEREQSEGDISTFNISVLVTDDFMHRSRQARAQGDHGVLTAIADHAWQTGEPGLIFIDRINEHNPMRDAFGDIRSTNPCVTGDTWVQTHIGPRQVAELVGVDFCASVDGTSYPLRSEGFWKTGRKPVLRVRTRRGLELRLTGNHKLARVVEQTWHDQEVEWTEAADLAPGDSIRITNHRDARPWGGPGSREEGWLLGLLIGDGTFRRGDVRREQACLDSWGEDRQRMAERAAAVFR